MPDKYIKQIKENPARLCLALLLAIQLILIAYGNIALTDQNLDYDCGKLFHHIQMMWKEKTLLLPNWSYLTTLEWDCTTVFALPLYGLTGNICLAAAISDILLLLLLVATLFYLFQGQSVLYPLLAANLICLPYRIGMLDYYNMLFFMGAQYIIKVMVPLLAVGLVLAVERRAEKEQSRGFWFFFGLYVVFLTVCSMSGSMYVAVCGLFPVFATYLCHKFMTWKRIPVRSAGLMGATLLCAAAGTGVNHAVMGGTRGDSMVLCNVYELWNNIQSGFMGMFELFGGLTPNNPAIISGEGIAVMGKFCLTALFLVCGISAAVSCRKGRGDLRMLLLLSVFGWNWFVLMVSNVRAGSATYEYRYHLIGMLPLMCVAAIVLIQKWQKMVSGQRVILFAGGMAALIFLNAVSFKALFERGEQNAELKEFCAYFEQSDLEIVYLNDAGDADICRVLDDHILYIGLEDDGTTWAYDNYAEYNGGVMQTEGVVVAVDMAKEDLGESFYILDHKLVWFDTVANRKLYYVENE
ncbi:MAG: hypothetical protein NC398_02300 [Acetatifactor muris]|nr:hypothetical protein [Acetatifactor muris]